jgi:hypothetical protein
MDNNWVYKYLKHEQGIKTRYIRKHSYERALCKDPTLINEFFDNLERAVMKNRIIRDRVRHRHHFYCKSCI